MTNAARSKHTPNHRGSSRSAVGKSHAPRFCFPPLVDKDDILILFVVLDEKVLGVVLMSSTTGVTTGNKRYYLERLFKDEYYKTNKGGE